MGYYDFMDYLDEIIWLDFLIVFVLAFALIAMVYGILTKED